MYRIGIFFVLYFGISAGVSATENAEKHLPPPAHEHTKMPPKPAEKSPNTAGEFHKQAEQIKIEQVKIQPPVVVQKPVCGNGQHLENEHCVADKVVTPPVVHCPDGSHLVNGHCVKDTPPPEQTPKGTVSTPSEAKKICGNKQIPKNSECHLITPPREFTEKPQAHPATPVEKQSKSHVQKEQIETTQKVPVNNVQKKPAASVEKPTENHTETEKPHKKSGKVQPCNGGFIPVEEECTPTTTVKQSLPVDDFAKRQGIDYCKENPEECGVVSMEKFKAARNEGIEYCKKDPLLCDLYSKQQIETAKKEGIEQCQKFPSLCGLTRLDVVATPK